MTNDTWASDIVEKLREQNLERTLKVYVQEGDSGNGGFLNFSSNDYLGFSTESSLQEAAKKAVTLEGVSSSSSRLFCGTLEVHQALEEKLAAFFKAEAALTFSSGFMTNLAVVGSLVGRNDWVIVDKLSHASILDGAHLSRAKFKRFSHNDTRHLEDLLKVASQDCSSGGRVLVVTESVFSMDGDLAPLAEIAALAKRYGAMLMVDEAHAIGVFGPLGRGILAQEGLQDEVDVVVGTFGKALGSYGGFCLCSEPLKRLLVNQARPFIYNTSLPPAVTAASLHALLLLEQRPGMGQALLDKAACFRTQLQAAGLSTLNSESQIVPVLLGDAERALAVSSRLKERGVLAVAVRPPTVPEGSSRLRLSVTHAHSEEQLENTAAMITQCSS